MNTPDCNQLRVSENGPLSNSLLPALRVWRSVAPGCNGVKRMSWMVMVTGLIAMTPLTHATVQPFEPYPLEAASLRIAQPSGLMVDLMRDGRKGVLRNRKPLFSWIVNDPSMNAHQWAWQVIVSSSAEKCFSGEGDLWDSGVPGTGSAWETNPQSLYVPYDGKPLQDHTTYYWKVRTWTRANEPGFWSDIATFKTGVLTDERPVDALELEVTEVAPKWVVPVNERTHFVDFGKAAFATVKLRVQSPVKQMVEVHLGEVKLSDAVAIDRQPGGARRYQMIPLEVEKGSHVYQVVIPPDARNTGHFAILMPAHLFEVYPFRYMEVVSNEAPVQLMEVRQLTVHYPFDDSASSFVSSNEVLNDVWELCKYSMKATSFCGYYVDGDRERIPYEADVLINQLGHYCVDREYAMARRTHEHLILQPTWPTEWILQSVILAWHDYQYTGEPSSLRYFYDDLMAKTLMGLAREDGLILLDNMNDDVLKAIHFAGKSSDFFKRGIRDIVDWPQVARDGFEMLPVNISVNAFHYRAVYLMLEIAKVLGKTDDIASLQERLELIRESFMKTFFNESTGLFVDGEGSLHASLHANMFAVAFGLVPEFAKERVMAYIKSKGMACSVYGAQFLLESLYAEGEADHALALLSSVSDRSWANMIYNVGSTITLEAWDNRYKPNQDWNHAWGAAPANLIPRFLMGVQPLKPGFEEILIKPQPGDLKWARLKTPTVRGPVTVMIDQEPGRYFQLVVETPANTTSRMMVPVGRSLGSKVLLNGRTVHGVVEDGFLRVDSVGSGRNVLVYYHDQN
jgi:alpha-L-rhamnosidase